MAEYLLSLLISSLFTLLLYEWKRPPINWRRLIKLVAIEGTIALSWDLIAVWRGWWSFINPQFLIGVYFLWLPIEEVLFFIAVTIGVVVMWECVKESTPARARILNRKGA